MKFEEAVW